MEELHSILDLAQRFQGPQFDLHRRYYSISHLPATELKMNDPAWRQASSAFGVERSRVESQHIVSVRDVHLGHEALFNPLRANRIKTPSGLLAADLIDKERLEKALERVPERRYQTADELKTAVETVADETMNTTGAPGQIGAEELRSELAPPVLSPEAGHFTPGLELGTVPRELALLPPVHRSRLAIAGAGLAGVFLLVLVSWLLDCGTCT